MNRYVLQYRDGIECTVDTILTLKQAFTVCKRTVRHIRPVTARKGVFHAGDIEIMRFFNLNTVQKRLAFRERISRNRIP